MKRSKILTAALAASALSGVSAMAQFNYQNGDLIAAFGNGGSTDILVNLGTLSIFTAANAAANSWDLNAVLNATFGSVNSSGMYWAVFGVNNTSQPGSDSLVTQTSPYTIWSTLAENFAGTVNATPTVSGKARSQHLALNQIGTITGLTSPGEAGSGLIVDVAPDVEQVATSLGGFSSLMNNPAAGYNGNLAGTWNDNMLNYGEGTSDFYQNDPGNPNSTPATDQGTFSLGGGVLAFEPVPEPSTRAMMGSGLTALLGLPSRQT